MGQKSSGHGLHTFPAELATGVEMLRRRGLGSAGPRPRHVWQMEATKARP